MVGMRGVRWMCKGGKKCEVRVRVEEEKKRVTKKSKDTFILSR